MDSSYYRYHKRRPYFNHYNSSSLSSKKMKLYKYKYKRYKYININTKDINIVDQMIEQVF